MSSCIVVCSIPGIKRGHLWFARYCDIPSPSPRFCERGLRGLLSTWRSYRIFCHLIVSAPLCRNVECYCFSDLRAFRRVRSLLFLWLPACSTPPCALLCTFNAPFRVGKCVTSSAVCNIDEAATPWVNVRFLLCRCDPPICRALGGPLLL